MTTKIYVTQSDNGHDIYPTGYFLTVEDAKDQMAIDWHYLTERERKAHTLWTEAWLVEHEEPITKKNIERVYSDWLLDGNCEGDAEEYIEFKPEEDDNNDDC